MQKLLFQIIILCLGLTSLRAEEAYHCSHCKRLATQWMAAEADPSKAPNRKYAPDRHVDVKHLKLEVIPDFQARTVSGKATMQFLPLAMPLRQLKLNAVELQVQSIESSHKIQAHQVTDSMIEITFATAIPAGEKSEVTINYTVTPEKGLFFRTAEMGYKAGDTQLWTQGEPQDHRHWFPSHDYPNEKFTTEMICHVPDGMVALSNGRLLSEKKNEDTGLVAFHWLQDKVHVNYLVTLLAGHFEKLEDTHGDLPIALYVPPSEKDQAANTFKDTKKILQFFEKEIGVAFPWDKYYNACALDYMFGGMENTSLTTLTVGTLFTDAQENLRSSRSLDAHEIAHQWFGDLVTCRDWSHLWLNEGFATYYSLLYDQNLLGDDFFKYGLYRNSRGILNNSKDTIPIVYRDYSDPMEQFSFRAYPKGGWVLHMLRSQLGPDLFRKCVATYLERHQFETVVTQDLIDVFQELSGRSLQQFFDQWVYLSGYPELNVDYKWNELTGQAKISVKQVQMTNEKRPWFNFPLPVRFTIGDSRHEVQLDITKEKEDFYVSLDKAPELVRLDPEVTVLAKFNFKLSKEMLAKQLADTTDVIGRIEAIKLLADKKSIAPLKEALNKDTFFAVRTAAADGLAKMRTPESFEALSQSLNQPDARARQAVVRGLTRFHSGEAFAALRRVADNETNPDIRTIALSALGQYVKPELRTYLLSQLSVPSYKHAIASSAIGAMRKQDDPFYVEPLLRELQSSEAEFTSGGFSTALRALGYLARNEENKEPVRLFLLKQVDHLKRNVARSAMSALGDLHDAKAIPVMETFVAADSDSADGKAAQAAINQIRKDQRPRVPEEVNTLRSQVSDLRGQLTGMSEEMKALRAQFKEAVEKVKPDSDKAPKSDSADK
ncbi:MAG: aminopeptidase N [Verrucomicrobiales bacterium]|jgi:aminopeptidase N